MNLRTYARIAVVAFPIVTVAVGAEAATVGFWQFNAGAFLEDSAGSADLTVEGTVSQVTLPAIGRGSEFPGTSPAADFPLCCGSLVATITPITGDFSIEACIPSDADGNSNHLIAASATSLAIGPTVAWALEIRQAGR